MNIISAIKNALKQENLNPEIEEKLLTLQRYQEKQMKTECPSPKPESSTGSNFDYDEMTSRRIKSPSIRKRNILDDDDWILDTPKKRLSRPLTNEKRQSAVIPKPVLNVPQYEIANKTCTPQSISIEKKPVKPDTPLKKVQNKQNKLQVSNILSNIYP